MFCVAMMGMHFGWREKLKNLLSPMHYPYLQLESRMLATAAAPEAESNDAGFL
jgi:hypothetical protein